MTVIIGFIEGNYITGRSVFDSYESAAEVLEPGTFVEETEETGILYPGGYWNGTTCAEPEPVETPVEEVIEIEAPTE